MDEACGTGAAVEIIDILRNEEKVSFPFTIEPSERLMCGIWFYSCKRGAASIIETMNQSGIASEAFGGCNIFDAVIFPQPVSGAKGA